MNVIFPVYLIFTGTDRSEGRYFGRINNRNVKKVGFVITFRKRVTYR